MIGTVCIDTLARILNYDSNLILEDITFHWALRVARDEIYLDQDYVWILRDAA